MKTNKNVATYAISALIALVAVLGAGITASAPPRDQAHNQQARSSWGNEKATQLALVRGSLKW